MKWLVSFLAVLCGCGLAFAEDNAESTNANSRYTIERVVLEAPAFKSISSKLRTEINDLVGQHFDPGMIASFAQRIHKEIRRQVTHKLERGSSPEYVRVIFDAERPRLPQEPEVTKIRYHQKQGVTAGANFGFDIGETRLNVGMQTDADELLERFTGFNAGISRELGERVRAHFVFEAFHQEWNNTTLRAIDARQDVPGIYRERFNAEPGVSIEVAPGLILTGSVSFQHIQTQFPAARFHAANALETTLRYTGSWRASDSFGQELDAGYNLRAATNLLGSDFVYTRHKLHASYSVRHDHHLWTVRGLAGTIEGNAPLFDRFSLGNTRTLRGHNKFDIAALGGERMAYGSASYRYRAVGVFYDAGSVWDDGTDAKDHHSVGVTIAAGAFRDGPYLTLAFPLRGSGFQPLFMLGMNF